MRSKSLAVLLLLATGISTARDFGPPVITLGWGGCGSSWDRVGYTRLRSNPLFQNNLINVSPLPPLNGSIGYVGDAPNYLKTLFLSLMPEDAVFPFAPDTGLASGKTTFNVFGRPTEIQVSVDQKQRVINVSFIDPFDNTAQKTSGSYIPTGTIRTFGGNPQALGGDPIATGSGEQIQTPGPDLVLNGPFPVVFRRYYASYLTFGGINSALGQNWLHNYDVHLYLKNGYASIVLADGTNVYFQQSGGGYQAVTPLNYSAQFVATAGGYRFLDTSVNLIYGFDGTGNLIRMEDRSGNGVDVQQGPNGPTQVSDGLGRLLVFSYIGSNLASVKDGSGRTIQFTQSNGNLAKITDADGKSTQYTYSVANYFSGLISSIISPRANKPIANAVYDAQGRVVQQTDSRNHITTVSYTGTGTTIKDPVGSSITDQYQASGILSGTVDGLGNASSYASDPFNRITTITDRNGNKSSISYDAITGYIASTTDAEGNITRYTYQSQSQSPFTFYVLSKISNPDNTSETFTYDGKGNLLTFTDRAGNISKYSYNPRGQVLAATNAAGGVTTYAYGNDATLMSVTDPSGNTTMYAYDSQFRVKQITEGDGSTRTFAYDNRNNLISSVDALGQTTTATFDDDGNLVSATDALGGQTTNSYDSADNLAQVTNAGGATTVYSYNDANLLTGIGNGGGQPRTIQYDAGNRILSIKGANGKGTSYTYDKEGGVASVTDALNRTVKFTRNKDGLLNRITTPAGANYDVTRDALGRVLTSKDPLGAVTTYRYDGEGRVNAITAPTGISAGFGYDALGSLKQVTDPNGSTWFFSNDSQGRLTSVTDPLGSAVSYQYDQRDNLIAGTNPLGSFMITRDAAGRPIQNAYSDGTTIAATRDPKGRITAATNVALSYDALDRITGSNGLAITYAGGRIGSITNSVGLTVSYTSAGNGLTIADWAGGMVTLAYNDAGQIISVTRSNGVVTQYTYDADGRVASITESSGDSTIASTTIKRNAAGRIVGTDQNVPQFNDPAPGILQLGYDAAEQVAGAAYDGLGRLNADALRNYTWDMASRMTGYSGADGSATATYDDAGLRVSRTGADGTTLNHIWNYATPLPTVATVQSGGADLRYYVYTPDGTLLYSIEASDGSRHFYHFDQSGSTLFLTDDGGNITDTYAITPFGESVAHSGSTDNPFTWLGQFGAMQEGGTSLFYLRARYYDSATARFLSRDPLRANDPRQINPYQYAADNPVTSDDATGLRVNNRLALDWARSMTNYNYSCYFDSRSISSRYRISPERLKSLGLPGDDSEGESGGTPWTRRSIPMAGAWQRGTDGGGGGSRDSKAPPFDRALDLSKIQFGGAADSDSSGLRSLQRALANSPWSGRE